MGAFVLHCAVTQNRTRSHKCHYIVPMPAPAEAIKEGVPMGENVHLVCTYQKHNYYTRGYITVREAHSPCTGMSGKLRCRTSYTGSTRHSAKSFSVNYSRVHTNIKMTVYDFIIKCPPAGRSALKFSGEKERDRSNSIFRIFLCLQ